MAIIGRTSTVTIKNTPSSSERVGEPAPWPAAPTTDDEWGRMHAALTAWKATSLLQQAARELDRAMTVDNVSTHVSDRFQRAAENARTAAAALDELDEYLHAHIRAR